VNSAQVTRVILLVVVAVLIVWDAWAIGNKTPDDTVTHIVRQAVRDHPILGIALGVVIGHLFWR
jgi:hypothetical protein